MTDAPKRPTTKPSHYRVICISMYTRDIEELDAKVAELKRRGWARANKSLLIRLALAQLDVATLEIPRGDDASEPTPMPRLRKLTSGEAKDAIAKSPQLSRLLGAA